MDSDNPQRGSSEADFVPKVFVSYSWAGKARAKRIADFLRAECGVDVVIDIYHLKPGQNKYAFMQRIVDDASIDRVLVLCDQAYQERANNFEGGVGDEATIISPKIYKDAKQTKFLPVVMEKDDEGNPYIPTFADGRIYFDLSDPKTYDQELKRLVRELYNLPTDREPPLGGRPKWLDFPAVDTSMAEERAKAMAQLVRKNPDADTLMVKAADDLLRVLNGLAGLSNTDIDLPALIAQTEPIRNTLVDILDSYVQLPECNGEQIAQLLESLNNGIAPRDDVNSPFFQELNETYQFFFWESWLCAAAIIIHYEKFKCLRQLLNRTYFVRKMLGTCNDREPIGYSFFRPYLSRLEEYYRNQIKEQRPITLAGRILVNRLYPPLITKSSLVNSDLVLSHLSIAFARQDDPWYPTLAPYWHSAGRDVIWTKAVSKAFCEKLYPLFESCSIDEVIQQLSIIDEQWKKSHVSRGGLAYGGIPSISYFTPIGRMGTLP